MHNQIAIENNFKQRSNFILQFWTNLKLGMELFIAFLHEYQNSEKNYFS